MGIFILCCVFACVIGSPAILGLWCVRLYYHRLPKDADFQNSTGIAVGFALVTAASALSLSDAAIREFGKEVRYLPFFAIAMFIVGLLIGWAECRERK